MQGRSEIGLAEVVRDAFAGPSFLGGLHAATVIRDGAPGEIRTPDLTLRRRSLYPAELRARFNRIPQIADSQVRRLGIGTQFALDCSAADAGKNKQREAADPGAERERLGKVKRDDDADGDEDGAQENEHAHAIGALERIVIRSRDLPRK